MGGRVIPVGTGDEALTGVADPASVDGILISIYQPLHETVLSHFPRVRFISVFGTSTKLLPMDYCKTRGIQVLTVTEYCDRETAEWVTLQVMKFFRYQKPGRSVFERKLGIIGMGAVGKRLLTLAHALNMAVYYNSPRAHPELGLTGALSVSKEEILSLSDIVSVHTPAHFSFLNLDLLKNAKPNLCLINTCMGRISIGSDLEKFLEMRPDVSLIMDSIAGASYQMLERRAEIARESAFFTIDSENRLINKFFTNLESCT